MLVKFLIAGLVAFPSFCSIVGSAVYVVIPLAKCCGWRLVGLETCVAPARVQVGSFSTKDERGISTHSS